MKTAPLAPWTADEAGALSASRREENAALAPLAVATLRALLAFPPAAFKAHLKDFFPLLTGGDCWMLGKGCRCLGRCNVEHDDGTPGPSRHFLSYAAPSLCLQRS